MSWQKEVDEIAHRKALSREMGGPDKVARQHLSGKLTARERIERLVDEGSFREYGALAGHAEYDDLGNLSGFTPSNVVIGSARLEGRRVVVCAEDFTVRGGSSEAARAEKWIWAERLALSMGRPLIRLVDTAGGSVKLLDSLGATKLPGYASWPFSQLLGQVPVVAVALGPVAGLGAFRVVTSHFSIMTRHTSQVFAAGPPLVTPATGEECSKEELGGFRVHARGSGVVDNEAEDESRAFEQVRRFLSYLPPNVHQAPPKAECGDPPDRREEELLSIIPRDPRQTYDARRLAGLILDKDSVFEIGRHQGRSVVALLGRLNGFPVGVMASDTRFFGGGMDHTAAEKIIRFVDMCDTFHLPVVNLFDQPGVVIGRAAEKAGTIRFAARALQAIAQSSTPWAAVIIRRAFGVAGSAYGRQQGLNLRYAWPSARWGSLPIEGGIEAAHKSEIAKADNPEAYKERLHEHYQSLQSPFRTAERFGITDIIDPRDTRPVLCDWVDQAYEALPRRIGPKARTMRV